MLRRSWTLAFSSAALWLAPAIAAAAEVCHAQSGQYGDTRTCVTSVLAPQAGKTYGPEALAGSDGSAWCEGVAGPGTGQAITLHQAPESVVGTVSFGNGYARTPALYRANGRVKQAEIRTSGGYHKVIALKDSKEIQSIAISPSKVSWIRLTILDVYPGARGTDTCVTTFHLNQEDFLEGESQQ
jgi:hypothetical protein